MTIADITAAPRTERLITREIEHLERAKSRVVTDWINATGNRDWTAAEKATTIERKALQSQIVALREERKALKEAARAAREARLHDARVRKDAERAAKTAECQICERRQCLDARGEMVHHGYQRPGWGTIVGDCFGVHRLPYPAVDALVEYDAALNREYSAVIILIKELPDRTEIFRASRWMGDPAVTFVKGACADHEWRRELERFTWELGQRERSLRDEIGRVRSRIERAKEVR